MGKHGRAEGNHNSPPPGRRGRGGGPNFLATSSIATTPPLRGNPPPSEEGSRCAVIHEGFGLFKVGSIILIFMALSNFNVQKVDDLKKYAYICRLYSNEQSNYIN